MNFGYKHLLIPVLLLLIIGAAFNDGFTGWLLSIPLLGLLYYFLPYKRVYKLIFIPLIFALVCLISNYKTESSIIYPVIGQKVVVLEDIPLGGASDDGDAYNQTWFDLYQRQIFEKEKKNIEVKDVQHIPQGSIFYVEKVRVSHPDLSNTYYYYFSNDNAKFHLIEWQFESFCRKVEWEFCEKADLNDDLEYSGPDPMNKLFRLLASLP